MEENLRLNIFIRALGLCLCLLLLLIIVSTITGHTKAPLDTIIGCSILFIFLAPFCVLGYIPGRFLEKLPHFLVNLLKLKAL